MSVCIWYVSKYTAIPSARSWSTRAFLLMREVARMGHKAVILTSDSNHLTTSPQVTGAEHVETLDGVEMHWIKTRKYQGANSLGRILSWFHFEWRLWRLPKGDLPRPDAVIVSSLSLFTIFNGLWLRRKYGCRLIFEVRDIWPLVIVEEGGFSPLNPLVIALRQVEKFAYHRADAIVGTMPNLVEHVDESVDRHGPVHCIPMGVDLEQIADPAPVSPEWVERYVPKGKFIICHAGTIGITNALDTVFECARMMRDRPDVHFLMVGEGGLRAAYQEQCADLPNVSFTGPVPKDVVPSVLRHCDLVYYSVHVSKVLRFGVSLNKLIDYMMAGKPIVASYTGYPTMVDEAGAGTSVPAGEAEALRAEILRLAALPAEELEAMGRRGREWLLANRDFRTLARDYLRLALPDRPELAA